MATSLSVQTYHCICSNLVIASSFPLDKRRKLDGSIILPRPRVSQRLAAAAGLEAPEELGGDDYEELSSLQQDVTMLISTMPTAGQAPLLIRSDEGIEKRYPLRCGRCKITLGYQLDWHQYEEDSTRGSQTGKREDVVYLLEDSVLSSDRMKNDRRP